jgi:hypothetical protein
MPSPVTITANGKEFVIYENILERDGKVHFHTFKLGGDYSDCINGSIVYDDNTGLPIYGKLSHAEYDAECSIGSTLNKGIGSILMIKTFIRYIHEKYPIITQFKFDDMSHIECATEENIARSIASGRPRKRGSHIIPMTLPYLSIAYNGKTWYEKNFNAEYTDSVKYQQYRDAIKFLYRPSDKLDFDIISTIARIPTEQHTYLRPKYNNSSTYSEFFHSIPKEDRCAILRPWLDRFIKHYLDNKFSHEGWVIDILKMNMIQGGGKRKTRKRTAPYTPYYIPKGKIVQYNMYQIYMRRRADV